MKSFKIASAAFAAAALMSGAAQAGMLLDSSMYAALVGTNNTTIGDVNFATTPASKTFVEKSRGGFSGLGVGTVPYTSEIEFGESIMMTLLGDPTKITSIDVALLYNGPEFNDVVEQAKITAYDAAGASVTGILSVTSDLTASWSLGLGSVTNLSPAANTSQGGAWSLTNPFGSMQVSKLVFETTLGGGCEAGTCTNPSDYVLSSVAAIPEPSTYALMIAGLGAVGFVARRRARRG